MSKQFIRFGITERGDVAFHEDWIQSMRAGTVQAAILISKGLPTPKGKEAVAAMKDRIVFHATTTGYGGTVLEPGVKPYALRLAELCGFCRETELPKDHVVVRVDPIIPTLEGVEVAEKVVRLAFAMGFRRFRYSWMDVYGHVIQRFQNAGLQVPPSIRDADPMVVAGFVDAFCSFYEKMGASFESCAELNRHQAGCISKKDFELCGLDPTAAMGKSGQRAACMCCGNKTELLHHKGRCPHNCLYCYWR